MNNSLIDQIFASHFSNIGDGVRPEQRLVIESVISGQNTLSIMPTGGGKSLCYWIAGKALMGTTLAIFPLTALMDEQSTKLRNLGFKVINLHSGLSASAQHKELVELHKGKLPDFIFVSPERIGNDGFLEFILREQSHSIKLVVIDEIHCISQWGHDFRPFYKEIPPFLDAVFQSNNKPVILGLTATLNQKDTQQVCLDFQIKKNHVFKSQYLLRYPIEIKVVKVKDELEKDVLFWDELGKHQKEKVLVYIDNRNSGDRSTEGFCARALQEGFQAAYFHGSMSSDEKADVIKKFKDGNILTVFATSAFGMGIDIPDIRGVIHYRPPESIEQYYQQIGRTGRDGGLAWALIYFSDKNVDFRKSHFIDRSFPTEDEIRSTFQTITAGSGTVKSFDYFSEENAQTAFHYLLRTNVISLRCKSIQKIDPFETTSKHNIPEFDRYKNATRTGITVLVAQKSGESVEQITENVYKWWADNKIKTKGIPQKCLIVEQLKPELSEETLQKVISDIEEKKAYRYGLLDQLVELLEGYTNSISLHQQIGRYLGVDKFQMDRIHQTVSGEMVRSKSEVIIANLLTEHKVQFDYENELNAGGITFVPDFEIKVGQKVYYWEHLGRLDLEQYRQNWKIKKSWYDKYFPNQLITTEESSTLSQKSLQIIQALLQGSVSSSQLQPTHSSDPISSNVTIQVKILTEGRTDWKHLKAALARFKKDGYFLNLLIEFQEIQEDMGDKELINTCRSLSRFEQTKPIVCIFDRDVPTTLNTVTSDGKNYKDWGHQVYSIALPVPDHRRDTPEICIEFCYQDQDIQQADDQGRHLYIGTEFSQRTGIDKNGTLTCADRNKCGRFTIVDQQVFQVGKTSEENIALSKAQFANYVLNSNPGFDKFDITGFLPVFQLIEEMLNKSKDNKK